MLFPLGRHLFLAPFYQFLARHYMLSRYLFVNVVFRDQRDTSSSLVGHLPRYFSPHGICELVLDIFCINWMPMSRKFTVSQLRALSYKVFLLVLCGPSLTAPILYTRLAVLCSTYAVKIPGCRCCCPAYCIPPSLVN